MQAAYSEGIERARRVDAEAKAVALAAENARLSAAVAAPPPAPAVSAAPAPPDLKTEIAQLDQRGIGGDKRARLLGSIAKYENQRTLYPSARK